jgi:glycosyltransferase involved in cell wall biosynthesis
VKVLYLQHAWEMGGSCVSLRRLLDAVDRSRVTPVVALIRPTPEVAAFHAAAGVEIVREPRIVTFEHTTALWTRLGAPRTWVKLAATVAGWRRTERATLDLVARVRPDLVHLNSAVLLPSARALHRAGVPFVWHVRESPVRGYAGVRLTLFRHALRAWPDEAVFLTETERGAWVGGGGIVIPELVDLGAFDPALDGAREREARAIPTDARVVLYAGGFSALKGIEPLVEALWLARERTPQLLCLMPGALGGAAAAPGASKDVRLKLVRLVGEGVCRLLPFSREMPGLLAASDLLVFPAMADHFALPVVEAGAMRKPVIASRFPIVEEQVTHGGTGLLVAPGDPRDLAEAIVALLSDPLRAEAMGAAGRASVARFDAVRNAGAFADLYHRILARRARPIPRDAR